MSIINTALNKAETQLEREADGVSVFMVWFADRIEADQKPVR